MSIPNQNQNTFYNQYSGNQYYQPNLPGQVVPVLPAQVIQSTPSNNITSYQSQIITTPGYPPVYNYNYNDNNSSDVVTQTISKPVDTTPSAPPLPIDDPVLGVIVEGNENGNGNIDKKSDTLEVDLDKLQMGIKYQLEHLLFKSVKHDYANTLSTTIYDITTLEIKNIPDPDNYINPTHRVYMLKLLLDINNNYKEYCHVRVTHNKLLVPAYKVDRCLFEMKPSDELGYLEA